MFANFYGILAGLVLVVFAAHCTFVNLMAPKRRPRKTVKAQHVVITGGSSGIGKAAAIECSKRGAHVTIIARNAQKLAEARDEIETHKESDWQVIHTVEADVADFEKVTAAILKIDTERPVFMLINCAGLAVCGKLEDLKREEVETMVNVNLYGTINCSKAIIERMKERKDGVIVNVSSQGGLVGIFGYTVYAATKFAVRGFTEALRMEAQPHGIQVTLALPPDTDTPGFEIENQSKPEETRIISEMGGLIQPEVVAKEMIKDGLAGEFYSYVGFESYLATTVCTGFAPVESMPRVYMEALLIGIFRVVVSVIGWKFQRIVQICHDRKQDGKNTAAKE